MSKPLHAQHQHVKRSAGKNACASAAYRSGEKIHDPVTGQTFDYSRKQRVDANLLIGWQGSVQELWQGVEAAETRKDAKLADEHEVSLPQCMTVKHRQQLALKIAQALAAEYGADSGTEAPTMCSIHNLYPPEEGENRTDNPHAHILIATRAADPTTATGLAAEKLPCHWSKAKRDKFGLEFETPSVRCTRLRRLIADTINTELMLKGYADEHRVDPRSYAEQGLDKQPQKHMGPKRTAMERRGVQTDMGDHNRKVVYLNERREALQAKREAVKTEAHKVTMEIVDLSLYRHKLQDQLKAEQQQRALAAEAKATVGMTGDQLRARAAEWRGTTPTDTAAITQQRKLLRHLQQRHNDGWGSHGTAADELRQAEKALDKIRGGVPLHRKILPFAWPAELRAAIERVERLETEIERLPGQIAAAERKLENMEQQRAADWLEHRETRHAMADLCDAGAVEADAKAAEAERRAELRAEIEAEQRQERINRHGYDPLEESRDDYLRRQAVEQREREQREAAQRPTPTPDNGPDLEADDDYELSM